MSTPGSDLPGVEAQEALSLVAGSALLVDVRELDEWDAGHAPQAQHVPLATVGAALGSLPKDRQVLVICRSGRRSQSAVMAMRTAGIDAYNVEGGMQAWYHDGGEVVSADGGSGTVI